MMPRPEGPPPPFDPRRQALFLDFDGTLVDIAPRPDAVTVPEGLVPLLLRLSEAAAGALAVVSGRGLAELARFLDGFGGVLVGSHGAERRGVPALPPPDGLADLRDSARFLAQAEGLHLEPKPCGVALHFRHAPERATAAQGVAEALAAAFPAFAVQPAKMAFELKPKGAAKDRALGTLLQDPPFSGRLPVFAGDDATDEPAMVLCAGCGGYGIKVGPGDSAATHRLPTPRDLRRWLAATGSR